MKTYINLTAIPDARPKRCRLRVGGGNIRQGRGCIVAGQGQFNHKSLLGSGLKGVDDLCFHTYWGFSLSSSTCPHIAQILASRPESQP